MWLRQRRILWWLLNVWQHFTNSSKSLISSYHKRKTPHTLSVLHQNVQCTFCSWRLSFFPEFGSQRLWLQCTGLYLVLLIYLSNYLLEENNHISYHRNRALKVRLRASVKWSLWIKIHQILLPNSDIRKLETGITRLHQDDRMVLSRDGAVNSLFHATLTYYLILFYIEIILLFRDSVVDAKLDICIVCNTWFACY